ncbi:TolC family outer membrane protein [Sphingomonas sp. DT-204]|uniref:TolC family outer membrane protein n=1 Tax=Sphingomonas sp. DT-204 TaxID=3396166 RepID=UPI003F1CCCB9
MMRRFLLTAAGGVAISALLATPASADTLREALVRAYNTNPTLSAARADLRAQDENVPIARADGLPSVQSQADFTETMKNAQNNFLAPERALNASASVSYPILSFGAVRNSVNAARTRVEAGRASLRGTEADLFTAVVAAYMDVIRDEAIVALNRQNVRALQVNLQATRDRFEVGDLTRTDVAQSEARLAVAEGQLRSAEAQLIASREGYVRIIGTPPGALEEPPALPNLPSNPDGAVGVALDNNPLLLAAAKARDATRYDVSVAKTARLPRVNVIVGGTYYNYLGTLSSASGTPGNGIGATAGLSMTLPLFQGGRPSAQVRQAQARRSQAIEQVTETERGVIAQTRSAYASWQSAQQVIHSSEIAVQANKLSLEGVRAENSVGTRTILDILNAEQELLNSQVTLVTARRDAYVAGFALLAAMGQAEAKDLGLDGGPLYDPVANYNRVKGNINDWDDDPDPQPIATRTVDTPAQTPVIGPNAELNDPALQRPVDSTPANPAVTPR